MLAIVWPMAYLHYALCGESNLNIKLTVYYLLSSSTLILLPYFLIPPKLRWLILIPIWTMPIYCLINLWYFRFFGDIIPFSSLFLFNNIGDTLFQSTLSVVGLGDVLYVFGAIVFTIVWIFYFHNSGRHDNFKHNSKILCVTLCLLTFLGVEFREILGLHRYAHKSYYNALKERYLEQRDCETRHGVTNGGIASLFVRKITCLIYEGSISKELSELQISQIENYFNRYNQITTLSNDFAQNRGKNLLFIVVESLNSEAVNASVGKNIIMPNLQNLFKDSSAIVCPNTLSQILAGVSSDGQFIYNTGLYPSSNKISAITYGNNTYESLAKMLNTQNLEIICEGPTLWNHDVTNKAYGYNKLIANLSKSAKANKVIDDAQLFSTCLEVMDTISRPTMIFATTMSMHNPYKSDFAPMPKWLADSNLPGNYKDYYNMCHAFDKALGEFMLKFKATPAFKNTVIAIASDHAKPDAPHAQDAPILFAALNTGIGMKIDRSVEQVDVFPTLLEIMGRTDAKFKGMGYSALHSRPVPASRIPSAETQEVANLILMSDYFSLPH